jgi:hypothetical protein
MVNKSRGTWYVSFELPRGNRKHARATETFPNQREAKKFASAKLADTQHVTAGTLNPHLPKRTKPRRRCLNGSKNRMKTIWLEPAGSPCPDAPTTQAACPAMTQGTSLERFGP